MRSRSFRLVSTLVTLVLLAAMVSIVILILRNAPSAPVSSHAPAALMASATPRGVTPLAPTQTINAVTFGTQSPASARAIQIEEGGFAFTPLSNYALQRTTTTATLTNKTGSIFSLRGGTPAQLSSAQATELVVIFEQFVTFYANRDNFQSQNQQVIRVDGAAGLAVDLISRTPDGFAGRIVMAQPDAAQLFLLVGVSPAAEWTSTAHTAFEQLVNSIRFFPLPTNQPLAATTRAGTAARLPALTQSPTPATAVTIAVLRPTPTPQAPSQTLTRATPTPAITVAMTQRVHPNWRVYSNGNAINGVIAGNNMIWAATDGGVSVWNRSNNEYAKFTTLDGLAVNRTTAVVDCPLPGFGLVFGSTQGLQIFDQQRNRWKTLDSGNSEMHFDDVTALYCSPAHGFLVVGYARHGIDVYDVKRGWSLFDQRRGLLDNAVSAITVVGDREQIWVASASGITVFTEAGIVVYDKRNTPLETTPVAVMVSTETGIVWLGAGNKVYRIEGEAWTIYSATYVLASAFPTGAITALTLTDEGTLWIGSDQGELCLFEPTMVTCLTFFTAETLTTTSGVSAIARDGQNRLYVALARDGVRMYDGTTWHRYLAPDELLAGNQVRAFAQDALGFLWLATEVGLYQLDPTNERVVQLFTQENTAYPVAAITALYAAPGGGLWVGGQGAAYYDGVQWQSYTKADGLAADQVQAIAGDERKRVWFGTTAGLSVWNGETFFTLTRADGLPSNNILTLLADDAVMWIGSDAGLLRFESNRFQIYTTATAALAGNRITALAKVADGALLIGTDHGLSRWVADAMSVVSETRGYPVSALGLAKEDVLWVGTNGKGLFYFDGAAWKTVPDDVRPPAQSIRTIAVDRQGSVWIAGAEGGMLRNIP